MKYNSKLKLIIRFLCILCIIVTVYVVQDFKGINEKESLYIKMENYLMNEKGYNKKDILTITIKHSYGAKILGYQEYSISVIFIDEPSTTYWYNDKNIRQTGVSGRPNNGEDYRHREN